MTERVQLRITPAEKNVFQAAADQQKITLSLWMRLAAWQIVNEQHGQVKLANIG